MKISQLKVKVSDIVVGYKDNDEEGVWCYNGKLNIRPAYQREFVYERDKEIAVINSVLNNYPINVMYWFVNENGNYEIIDGQQRTLSICHYYQGHFSIFKKNKDRYYNELTSEQKQVIDNYELMVFICTGNDDERKEWFEVINIAGTELTKQEIRNAVYSGPWVSSAKKYFSKKNCLAYKIGNKYVAGKVKRQDYLETAIAWMVGNNPKKIDDYMSKHKNNDNADELWNYFKSVINWVETIFPPKIQFNREKMKGVPWGHLYNKFNTRFYDPMEMIDKVKSLMADPEITNSSGIFEYVFDGDERHLNLRSFTEPQKRVAYERQDGKCAKCGKQFDFKQMEGDHIIPWCDGGKTIEDNLQMLCRKCNNDKRAS